MLKKMTTLFLALVMALSLAAPASAARVSFGEALETLETLGLVVGGDAGFEEDRAPTRYEAVVMLVRLLGKESAAKAGNYTVPFTDVAEWCEKYVGYAYHNSLASGVSSKTFSGGAECGTRDFLTFVLRALGYSDKNGDFTWADSVAFSDGIGLTHGEYAAGSKFLREDLALVCYTALGLEVKGTGMKLVEKLYREGAVSYSALVATRLADGVNVGRREYDSEGIYELASSSVFLLKIYETEDGWKKDEPSGTASGFFITADGAAVTAYHALDGARYARAVTTDGKTYELSGVLFYDYYRDIAVVRIGKTSSDGKTVTRFPYLETGDSGAVNNGSEIFTVSSPNGLEDSFSAGYVANKYRVVNDPEYPCIQVTAPISGGSSGGPLLNKYGEVIGVIYGTYTVGQNLNVCVPINCIKNVSLTGAGQSLESVCDYIDSLKDNAVITASETNIILEEGEAREIVISSDCPGSFSLKYEIDDDQVVACKWGSFTSSKTVPLTITAIGKGTAAVTVTFYGDNGSHDAKAVINVTVR